MQPIKKVLIALDHSPLDSDLVDYAQFFANITEVTYVHFIHDVEFKLSSAMQKEFPNLEKETLAERKKELSKVIEAHFKPNRTIESKFTISNESKSLKPLLKIIKQENIDLVMVGSKGLEHGGGTFSNQLARRCPCHVLTVPIGSSSRLKRTKKVKKLLVPIDFSDHSKQALERAILIGSRIKDPVEIICQNVFTVPSGYHYSGKSRKEFAEIMKSNAKINFEEFISEVDSKGIKIKAVYSEDINEDKTSDIRDLAKKEKVDGIILGSRGKTSAALLMGSIAEKLIRNEKDYPILVVRKKGDFEGFLDRIRKL